jgi:hypothetical protein
MQLTDVTDELLVICIDQEYIKQMMERLKNMNERYKVRDCSLFLAQARLLMNRKAPWNKGIVHWTPVVVNAHQFQRSFDTSALDVYLKPEGGEIAGYITTSAMVEYIA